MLIKSEEISMYILQKGKSVRISMAKNSDIGNMAIILSPEDVDKLMELLVKIKENK